MPEDHHLAIGDYGLIGDMNSAALVSREGSIDWLCFPRFDSPSVFAAPLDAEMGGRFDVVVAELAETEQAYVEDTNLLRTRLGTAEGALEVVDYMPCYLKNGDLEAFHEVHRRLRCVEGRVTARLHCESRRWYRSSSRLSSISRFTKFMRSLQGGKNRLRVYGVLYFAYTLLTTLNLEDKEIGLG